MKRTPIAVTLSVPNSPTRATGCSVTWGPTAKSVTNLTHRSLAGVRAGRHSCYDRLDLDLDRGGEGYRVRYVSAVRDQGRGVVIPLRGGSFEGYTTVGLGGRARLPFRVFRSTDHLVIDVAHRW